MFTSEIFRKKANEDAWSDGTGGMFGNGEGNPWTGGGGGGAGGMPNMAAEDQDQNAYIAPLTGVDESDGMSLQQLATVSDEALDAAYHYGRSTPGNSFGWQANLKSAEYAAKMINKGVTDIEAISDAIHQGWNTTAEAFVQNPDQFGDTEKLRQAGKLDAKLQQRAALMTQNYAQLPEEEKEKDRVVARALLQAITGQASENSNDTMANDSTSPVGGKINELDLFGKKSKPNKPTHQEPSDYHAYFAKPRGKEQVYRKPGEYYDKTHVDPLAVKMKEARKKKAVPSDERDPGAFATRKHIADQERRHREWDERQEDFYQRYPEYAPKEPVREDVYPALLKRMIGAHASVINAHGVDTVTECVQLISDTVGPVVVSESLITDLAREVFYTLTHNTTLLEVKQRLDKHCWKGKHKEGTKIKGGIRVNNCVPNESVEPINEDLEQQFDQIEEYVECMANERGIDAEQLWEELESVSDEQLLNEAEAWQTKKGKNKNGGLNKKGVASYRRSHPGSKLKTAVTTKPSKLKKGSKASKRRKSFCARMKGMKKHRTGAKTKRDPNSRINKSLRKWHCESVNEGRILSPQYVNLYLHLSRPTGDKTIRVGKNIPTKAIDALINKIVSKYSDVDPEMFYYTPGADPKR